MARRKRWIVLGALAGTTVFGCQRLGRRYRHDREASRARLAAVDRKVVFTSFGAVEYAERGRGEPLLVLHGILHGCDGALLSVRDLPLDRRVIGPSRFGYLGSSLPPDATPAAQADAYAELLDELAITQTDVIGISAGTTSALQFALRHPDRVNRLVVISGNLPGNPTAVAPPRWAGLFFADVPMWVLKAFARPALLGLMGVPRGFPLSAKDTEFLAEMAESVFPVDPRAQGAIFDAFVSNPDVNDYPLEAITVPTLIVHARDDPLASYDAAERAAARIPGARLVSVRSGGHLLLGQDDIAPTEIAAFLGEPVPSSTRTDSPSAGAVVS